MASQSLDGVVIRGHVILVLLVAQVPRCTPTMTLRPRRRGMVDCGTHLVFRKLK